MPPNHEVLGGVIPIGSKPRALDHKGLEPCLLSLGFLSASPGLLGFGLVGVRVSADVSAFG